MLLTRLLFLPYDLVNYGCGLLHVRRTPFITATAIGTLPGTVAFVLVGSPVTISVVLIVLSLVTSRLVKRQPLGDVQPLGE